MERGPGGEECLSALVEHENDAAADGADADPAGGRHRLLEEDQRPNRCQDVANGEEWVRNRKVDAGEYREPEERAAEEQHESREYLPLEERPQEGRRFH